MCQVNFEKKKRGDDGYEKDDGEDESSDEELGGALLVRPWTCDTEGGDKGFRQPGEKLHGVVGIASTYCRVLAIASRTALRKSIDSGAE